MTATRLSVICVFCWTVLIGAQEALAQKFADRAVSLTKEEMTWLEAHPDIVLGYTDSLEPAVIAGPNGKHTGMLVDALEQINKHLGTRVSLRLYDIPKVLENAQQKRVDGIIALHPEYAEKLDLLSTKAYWPDYLAVFTRRGAAFNGPEDFADQRVALIDKVYITQKMIDEHGKGATIVSVKTALDGLRAVAKGDADLFLGGSYNSYFLAKYQLLELVPAYIFFDTPAWQSIAVRSDWPELITILNKGLSTFSEKDVRDIIRKWSYLPEPPRRVELTLEEQVWIKHQPVVRVALYPTPPYMFDEEGEFSGYLVEIIQRICQQAGLTVELSMQPLSEALTKLQDGQEHVILGMIHTEERSRFLRFSEKAIDLQMGIFAKSSRADIRDMESIRKKTIASYAGYGFEPQLRQYLPGARFVRAIDAEGMFRLVARDAADATVQELHSGEFILQKGFINGVNLKGIFRPPGAQRIPASEYAVGRDFPLLKSILDRSYRALSDGEKNQIWRKWFADTPQKSAEPGIVLTPKEAGWIEKHQTIRVGFWLHPPYLYFKDGRVVGVAVDLLNVISKDTGITFQFDNKLDRFSDVLKGLEGHHGPDLVGALMPTPEREKVILFTKPYIESQRFIFTRDDAPFISSIRNLFGKKAAVVKDYDVHKHLVDKYPEIDLLVFNNNEEALSAVSSGIAMAFIGDLVSTPAMINEFGLKNLKAACPSGLPDHPLAMGIRHDWPELRGILDKALEAIPADKKAAIVNKWSTVRVEHGIRPTDVLKRLLAVTGVAVLIVLIFLTWNRQLTRKVAQRTAEVVETEGRFRATFEQAAVGIAHVCPEGSFLRINLQFCNIVGYSRDEMLALTFLDITHPEDLDADVAEVQRLLSGESNTYAMEKRYLHKDGKVVWVHLTVSLVREASGKPAWFVGVVKDIDERKHAEEALKESEEKIRAVINQSPVSIQIHDLDGKLTTSNESYSKLYAFNDDVLTELYEKYSVLEDEQAKQLGLMPYIEQVYGGEDVVFPPYEYDGIDTLKTLDFEKPISRNVWVQTRGFPLLNKNNEVTSAVFMSVDFTAQRQAENALRNSEEKFRSLMMQSPFSIQIVNPDGSLEQVNRAFMDLWGVSDDVLPEIIKNYNILKDEGAIRRGIMPFIEQAFRGTDVVLPITEYDASTTIDSMSITSVAGNRRWIQARLYPIKNAEGDVVNVVYIEENITERMLAEEKIHKHQMRLRALAAELTLTEERERRRIATDLHDGPAQSLALARLLLASVLKNCDDVSAKTKLDDLSQLLKNSIQQIREIMLDLSSPALNEIGLGAALSEWLDEHVRRRYGLSISLVDKTEHILLNNDMRAVLFRNTRELLTNIIKHAQAKSVKVWLEFSADEVRVIVEDDGSGFEPGTVTQRPGGEGAFGLFSVRECMTDMSGSLEIVSVPGKGTRATLIAPLKSDKEKRFI